MVGSHKMLVYDDIADHHVVTLRQGRRGAALLRHARAVPHVLSHWGRDGRARAAWQEPLRLECQAFVDWIRTGQPACSDAWMGVKVVRILEAAQKSLLNSGGRENTDL